MTDTTDRCLNTCIISDDDGRGYYCDDCPEKASNSNSTDDGYGRCKGCGGQEPKEVLEQMNGYCTSECERDNSDEY